MKIALTYLPFWPTFSPPLGITYIAAVLQERAHSIKLFDKNIELSKKYAHLGKSSPWDPIMMNKNSNADYFSQQALPIIKNDLNQFAKQVVFEGYEAIGLSTTSHSIYTNIYFASIIKKLSPKTVIAMGGPEITSESEPILRALKADIIDIAFQGEAEESVVEYFDHLEKGLDVDQILGTISPSEKNVEIRNKKRKLIDYNEVPLPYFDDYPLEDYEFKQIPIMMSRGCIAACSFCTERVIWRKYRVRNAVRVANELERNINQYKMNNFIFCDSLINGDIEELDSLVRELLTRKLDLTWMSFCRVDPRINYPFAKRIFDSGGKEMLVGFESGSQKVLDLMNKGTKVEDGKEFILNLYKAGIKIHGLFLIGFPGETDKDFMMTMRFIHQFRKYFFIISIGDSLSIDELSVIGKLPERFGVLADETGKPILDKDGEWTSIDGVVTPKIRRRRLKKLGLYLDAMELNWLPNRELQFKNRLHRWIYKYFLKSIRLYYSIKFYKD